MTVASGFVGQHRHQPRRYGQLHGDGVADSSDVVVTSTGAISSAKALAAGTYTVSGTDSDAAGDTGTWNFTLTVPSCGVVTESVGQAPAVGMVVNFCQKISTGGGGRVVILFPDNTAHPARTPRSHATSMSTTRAATAEGERQQRLVAPKGTSFMCPVLLGRIPTRSISKALPAAVAAFEVAWA